MPKYSVLEVVLENQVDFNNEENMTDNIINQAVILSQEIEEYLKSKEA